MWVPWGSVCIFPLPSFQSPLSMWILTPSIHTCLDQDSLQCFTDPFSDLCWRQLQSMTAISYMHVWTGCAGWRGWGWLSRNEQPVLADCRTALNSLFRSIAAQKTGTELVPQWRWGGWAHWLWRLLSCIVCKVRIYTHPFTADQLLCRAYQKEKQEVDSLQCIVVFTVRKWEKIGIFVVLQWKAKTGR